MARNNDDLFRRLTRLFRSGPIVKRRVKSYKHPNVSTAHEVFKKTLSHVYSTAMSAYGTYDRMARYSDYSEMEYTPEISSALDIYAEEAASVDDKGQVLHVYSENRQIKHILSDLFYDTLNVEFNLTPWVRDLVKYGDLFLFNDVSTQYGIQNVFPIPVNEVEREEGFDPQDPLAVRFRWVTQGNQVLENWQVTHFRLLGNDAFLPYGSSILESARRIWRQLILIEDAMLVYRVVRSPERRVFYIDVGNVPPEEVANYMEQAKSILRSNQVIDQQTGRVDLRYNPLPVSHSTIIPLLDGRHVTIKQLAHEYKENKVNWVYSIQDGTHRIVPGKVIWCGKNYVAEKLVRVWFDNERYVDAAPEHPFVMRDGTIKRADELSVNDKLMPLCRDLNKGYERCYNPETQSYETTYSLVEKDVYGDEWLATEIPVSYESYAYFVKSVNSDITKSNSTRSSKNVGYKYYAVQKIEEITGQCDVYCMTVVGPDGQDDRHNFATIGDESVNVNLSAQGMIPSGIILSNSVDEDYFIPIRGTETGTKIDTLAGGQNVTAIEDVEYIQKKLFAALKIPKAYLGYDETLSSKATLSQEDIRFSRTIQRIQRVVLSELNKLAIIHLFCHGYEGEDLLDFELRLNNPSTIAQQQKMELYRARFEIAGTVPEGIVDRYWIRKNILGLTDDEIDRIESGRINDRKIDQEIEQVDVSGGAGGTLSSSSGFSGATGFDLSFGNKRNVSEPGLGEPEGVAGEAEGESEGGERERKESREIDQVTSDSLLTSLDEMEEDDEERLSIMDDDAPVKAQNLIDKTLRNRRRRRHSGPEALSMPNLYRMVSHQRPGDSLRDPYDKGFLTGNPFKESMDDDPIRKFLDTSVVSQAQMTAQLCSILHSLKKKIGKSSSPTLISESLKEREEIDDIELEDVTFTEDAVDD